MALLVLSFLAVVPAAYAAVVVMWNEYTDPDATYLKIERSTDGVNWGDEKSQIDKALTGAQLETQPNGTYMMYRMKAYNSSAESIPSNVVDFTWNSSVPGGGSSMQTPGEFGFVNCDTAIEPSAEYDACVDAGIIAAP